MVTKLVNVLVVFSIGSVLAKIHMVTKLGLYAYKTRVGSVLAKIHMVTKQSAKKAL